MNILRNNTYKNMECIEIIISVNLFYAKQGRYKSMPRLRKCCICGAEFLSHNGNTCCSDKCRIERKREQDKRGNYRRYHRLSGIPENKICPVCGNTFYTIRNVTVLMNVPELAGKRICKKILPNTTAETERNS